MKLKSSPVQVALIVQPDQKPDLYIAAIEHGGGVPIVVDHSSEIPDGVGGFMVAGEGAFLHSDRVPAILHAAVKAKFPVLGIGWGMHAINVCLGGLPPVAVSGHGDPGDQEFYKHPVFMAPGGKVGYTIAGSGWVTVPSAHTHALMPAQIADGLLPSVYAEDQVVEAIEKPGREWLIGVQWPCHRVNITPKGFDSLLLALVERSEL